MSNLLVEHRGPVTLLTLDRPEVHNSVDAELAVALGEAIETFAADNGYCFAGGMELACWCDFRIASENAEFGALNRRWGAPSGRYGARGLAPTRSHTSIAPQIGPGHVGRARRSAYCRGYRFQPSCRVPLLRAGGFGRSTTHPPSSRSFQSWDL